MRIVNIKKQSGQEKKMSKRSSCNWAHHMPETLRSEAVDELLNKPTGGIIRLLLPNGLVTDASNVLQI